MKISIRALLVATMLLAVSGYAFASARNVELGEASADAENKNDLAARGQRNNLDGVPTEPTTILDSFAYSTYVELPSAGSYMVRGAHRCDPEKNTVHVDGLCVYRDVPAPGRTPGIPKVILPGASEWGAWYGTWTDNGNGVIDNLDRTIGGQKNFENDYDAITKGKVVVYISPGAHPTATAADLPGDRSPDFIMRAPPNMADGSPGNGFWDQGQGFPIVFYDGTLLRDYWVTTISEPVPTPTGDFLQGCPDEVDTCLVDVDGYVAIVEGPISEVYQSVAVPITDELPPPSQAAVHAFAFAICNPLLATDGFTGADSDRDHAANACDETGPVARKIQPPYQNPRTNPASTNALYDYATETGPWVHTKPHYTIWSPVATQGPYVMAPMALTTYYSLGFCHDMLESDNDAICSPPGYLDLETRIGAFRDIDGNGWIGQSQSTDPYNHGNRPDPNDYTNGIETFEFAGYCHDAPEGSAVALLRIDYTLVPKTTWGAAGVITHWKFPTNAATSALPSSIENGELVEENLAMTGHFTGDQPVKIRAFCYGDGANALFTAEQVVLFPAGTAGIEFEIRMDPYPVKYRDPVEGDKIAYVRDTQTISSWLL